MWLHEVDIHLAYSAFALGFAFALMVVVLFWRKK